MNKKRRIIVDNIYKKFKIEIKKRSSFLERLLNFFSKKDRKRIIEVLKGVSFFVYSGEIIGLIGENGCGKSTLLRIIAGIIKQDKGEIIINGKIISLINLNVGLKDRLTMRDNIFLIGSLFGMDNKKIKKKYNSILSFSGLSQYENTKLYQFSSGMRQRLVFSIAIYCDPDILLLDEVFEVGDDSFKKKSSGKIKQLVKNGMSVILVSHDNNLIIRNCDRIIDLSQNKKILDN